MSEGEKAAYFVVLSVFQALLAAWRSGAGPSRTDVVSYAVSAILLSAGLYVCYRANAAGDGERFLERYVCLSVPLTVWMVGAGFLAGAAMMYGAGLRGGAYTTASHVSNLVLWVAYFVAMRWLIFRTAGGSAA